MNLSEIKSRHPDWNIVVMSNVHQNTELLEADK